MERTARGLKLAHAGDGATAASWRWERGLGLSLSVRRAARPMGPPVRAAALLRCRAAALLRPREAALNARAAERTVGLAPRLSSATWTRTHTPARRREARGLRAGVAGWGWGSGTGLQAVAGLQAPLQAGTWSCSCLSVFSSAATRAPPPQAPPGDRVRSSEETARSARSSSVTRHATKPRHPLTPAPPRWRTVAPSRHPHRPLRPARRPRPPPAPLPSSVASLSASVLLVPGHHIAGM